MPDWTFRENIKKIAGKIRPVVKGGKKDKFVIYTNGAGGQLVKRYLETEFSIEPQYIIDNKTYDGVHVLNLEQAKKRDNKDACFLICSWNSDFYTEIRKAIYEAFPAEQVVDLFPKEDQGLPTKEEICNVLHYVDSYVHNGEKMTCL